MEPKENKMGTMPIHKLLISMALPMVISMLVQAFYNVVDSIFVSRLSENALTAVSLAFPVQNLMIAVATGTGVGMNAILSRSLGEKNQERANRAGGNGLLLAVLAPPSFGDIAQAFQEMGRYLRVNPLPAGTGWVIAEFVVYSLIGMATTILQIYTAISVGHLGKKNRGWLALLAYVGISIAVSILTRVCMSVFFPSDSFSEMLLGWQVTVDSTGWRTQGVSMTASTLGIGIGLELLKGTGFFFATRAILDKRLNLE